VHARRLLLGFLALIVLAAPVRAANLQWSGTLTLDFGFVPPFTGTGAGVATVNGSGGLGQLNTLTLAGGLTAAGTFAPLSGEALSLPTRSPSRAC
jgi:hypothetical protein